MPRNPELPQEDQTNLPQEPTDAPVEILSFEKVITPEHLEMVSQASGGFRFQADPSLPPGRTGYTNLETRTIYYNPLLLTGSPEMGIQPWKKHDIKGFVYHEAGHHAPEVVSLQEKLIADLKKIEIPEAYKGSPAAEERFIRAVWSNLDNTIADIWLESFMGRRPYYPVGKAIKEFQSGKGEIDDYTPMARPEQLMQILLRSRYFKKDTGARTQKEITKEYLEFAEDMEEAVSPEVFESFKNIIKSGAMNAMMEKGPFENYFASPGQREKCVDKKMDAYKQVFLPEYINLLEKELEERKKQKQQQKEQQKQQGQQGEQGELGEGGKPQSQPSEGAPLTKEEEEEMVNQIMEELEKAGKERESQTMSPEEEKEMKSTMEKIRKLLEKGQEGKGEPGEQKEGGEGEEEAPGEPEKKGKTGEEAIKELGKQFEKKQKEKARKGKAEAMQVKPEIVKKWEDIKEKYHEEVESLATEFANVFLDDRRKKIEYLMREGEIVPGLEFEVIAAMISGEPDPDVKMKLTTNPEFLETELEFIVDTSGSMSGEKIEKSIELLVTITEALKRTKETLAQENLLAEAEEPFRLGATKFSDSPERVTTLAEPISDKKEVTIIDKISQIGGGTEETGAIRSVYQEMKVGKKNVIKFICVLTDGEGNRAGVQPIMQQIEKDDEVIFLVVGFGSNKEDAQAIVDTYLAPLSKKEGNVHGFAAANPKDATPAVLEFIKREVNKRK